MKVKVDSDKIKMWRKERLWTQEQIAEMAGVSLRTIQRIEKGEMASNDSVVALARVFKVDLNEITVDAERQNENATAIKNAKGMKGLEMSFVIHAIGFAIGFTTLVVIDLLDTPTFWSLAWPLAFWLIGLLAHGATVLLVKYVNKMKREIQELETAG